MSDFDLFRAAELASIKERPISGDEVIAVLLDQAAREEDAAHRALAMEHLHKVAAASFHPDQVRRVAVLRRAAEREGMLEQHKDAFRQVIAAASPGGAQQRRRA